MRPIPYGRQCITPDDIAAVTSTLQSDYLTQGPAIAQFERDFADYTGAKYALAVSNGTAALHLAAMALEVKNGQKVITTPITFAASANCIRYCGGDVIFSDIDPQTALLDLDKLAELLRAVPKGTYAGVIPVDFAGLPVNLEKLRALADEFGLWIIQDACHSPGAFFHDQTGQQRYSGNGEYADLSVFSFHPVKHIASGEGGMITTNNKVLYDKLLMLRTHGITKNEHLLEKNDGGWYYEMQMLGFNYRLTDFQAALGSSQLKRAEEGLEKRRQIAKRYDAAFSGTEIGINVSQYREGHAYHLYVIQVKNRLGLYNHLKENQIYAQVHYIPVHLMPYYKALGWGENDFPKAEAFYHGCLSLPMFPTLSEEDQDYVIEKVLSYKS